MIVKCLICDKEYNNLNSMTSHIRNNHKEGMIKNVNYKIHDDKLANQSNFVHEPAKNNYKCLICNTVYTNKDSMYWHVKNKHNETGCKKGVNWQRTSEDMVVSKERRSNSNPKTKAKNMQSLCFNILETNIRVHIPINFGTPIIVQGE
jgi:hypothetical protein